MHLKHRIRHLLKHSFFLAGLISIAWFILRTGTKPSRFTYPCQQMAASAGYLWIVAYMGIPLAAFAWIRRHATQGKVAAGTAGILLGGILLSSLYLSGGGALAGPSADTAFPREPVLSDVASDIFVIRGSEPNAGEFGDLLTLMDEQGFLFYQMSGEGAPGGLIRKDDVVLIKVNCQWPERGGTNTDLVKAVIAAILAHPEGFEGEIIVVDNGQGRGSFQWPEANADDTTMSIQDVVDSFSGDHRVSTYLWDTIRSRRTTEYDQGNDEDGYIVNDTPNPRTGLRVTYPKFTSSYGTKISFRKGVWENGTYNNTRLKLINMPVLKTHGGYGVTGSLKHYVGVVSVSLGDPHTPIWNGGLGSAFTETRYPDITIMDAKWVNAVPKGYEGYGPSTPYERATRANQVLASTDPVALDYYAAKHILAPLAAAGGYSTDTIDPDSPHEATFAEYLQVTYREIRAAGYPVTMDEEMMNIHFREISDSPAGAGLFRPSTARWYLDYDNNGLSDYRVYWGAGTDIPVTGDWDNDMKDEIGLFRPSTGRWYLDYDNNGLSDYKVYLGAGTDIPITGDWDNDGYDEIGLFRPSTARWYLDYDNNGIPDHQVSWGESTDRPVTGDWDNDGYDEIGLFRPSTARWYLDYDNNGLSDYRVYWGAGTDIPVTADWDNDGYDEIGLWRPSTTRWYLDYDNNGLSDYRVYWGAGTDIPVTGKWT